jgi:hypothetical protein
MALKGPVSAALVMGGPTVEVEAPEWLTVNQRKLFRMLVDQARTARINLAALDANTFAIAAASLDEYITAPNAQTRRDLIGLLREIGATPMSRARLNVKPDTDKKSKMAQLLKMEPPKTA